MNMQQELIQEFKNETDMTRKILNRIPADKLTWRPHSKSMSLGQLALHIAEIPGKLAEFFDELTREVPTVPLQEASSLEEILSALEESEKVAAAKLSNWDDDDLQAEWTMTSGDQPVMAAPRLTMVRSLMLNHWYHHRGQLIVYLRLLDVPVPGAYGSSADEQ